MKFKYRFWILDLVFWAAFSGLALANIRVVDPASPQQFIEFRENSIHNFEVFMPEESYDEYLDVGHIGPFVFPTLIRVLKTQNNTLVKVAELPHQNLELDKWVHSARYARYGLTGFLSRLKRRNIPAQITALCFEALYTVIPVYPIVFTKDLIEAIKTKRLLKNILKGEVKSVSTIEYSRLKALLKMASNANQGG